MKIARALRRCSTRGPTRPFWPGFWIDVQMKSNQLLGSHVAVVAIMIAGVRIGTKPLGRPGVVVRGLGGLGFALCSGGGSSGLVLLGLGGNTHLGDLEDELVLIDAGREGDALGQRHLAKADSLVDFDE